MRELTERIDELKKLDKAEKQLRQKINKFQEGRQAFIEQSTKLFEPVTKQQEAATEELKKSVQEVQAAVQGVTSPEEKLINEWLPKVNDVVFGLQKDGKDGYIFGFTNLLKDLMPDLIPTLYQIQLATSGIRVRGTNIIYPVTADYLHVLTRNAKPRTADARNMFLRLVDVTVGLDFIALTNLAGEVEQRLHNHLQRSVKYREFIQNRYVGQPSGSGCITQGSPLQRLVVLLGAAKAGNVEANLEEFSGILDSLVQNHLLDKEAYKEMIQRFLRSKADGTNP